MIHVISPLFNTFTFIVIQFSCSTTITPASTLPLNQLVVIIAFDSLLVICQHLKNRYEKILPFIPQLGESSCKLGIAKQYYSTKYCFAYRFTLHKKCLSSTFCCEMLLKITKYFPVIRFC